MVRDYSPDKLVSKRLAREDKGMQQNTPMEVAPAENTDSHGWKDAREIRSINCQDLTRADKARSGRASDALEDHGICLMDLVQRCFSLTLGQSNQTLFTS